MMKNPKGLIPWLWSVSAVASVVTQVAMPSWASAAVVTRKLVVDRVVDGDTVHGRDSSNQVIKIRMQSIDAPESHLPTDHGVVAQAPWGDLSGKALTRALPKGTRVELLDFGKDKYGRTLGHLILNGTKINVEQVRQGQAVSYIICEPGHCTEQALEEIFVAEVQQACHEAQKAGRGIFNPKNPLLEMPFEFRLRAQKRQADKYVGNLVTHEFVSPENYRQIPVCDRIFFMNQKDAKALGYSKID